MGGSCTGGARQREDEISNITTRVSRCISSSAWSDAIYNGDLNEIKKIFDQHPRSLNSRINGDGESALHVAVKNNNINLIEFLLFKNINVNIQSTKTGNTALHEAAKQDNIFFLTILIHHGANLRIINQNGELAVSLANDSKIKSMFKPKNIQKIRNQRTLKEILTNPHIMDFEENDGQTQSDDDGKTDLVRQYSISESLPNTMHVDDWYIERFTEIEQDTSFVNEECDEKYVDEVVKESKFASEFGVELHEIIFFWWDLKEKAEFWNEIIGKDKQQIVRSKQLFELTYALVFATIKAKQNKKIQVSEEEKESDLSKNPSLESMKELTRILKHKIKKGKNHFALSKSEYISRFNNYLYQAGIELMDTKQKIAANNLHIMFES